MYMFASNTVHSSKRPRIHSTLSAAPKKAPHDQPRATRVENVKGTQYLDLDIASSLLPSINLSLQFSVLYVPEVGGLGFDMEGIDTRLAVFRYQKNLKSYTDDDVQEIMDTTVPFYPENSYYRVGTVRRGMWQRSLHTCNDC